MSPAGVRAAGGWSFGLAAAFVVCATAVAAPPSIHSPEPSREVVVVSDLPEAATAAIFRGLSAAGTGATSGISQVAAPRSAEDLARLLAAFGASGVSSVCLGTRPSRAALSLPVPVPGVFLSVEDLKSPADGRPVRGVRLVMPPGRILAALRRVVPGVRHVGVLCASSLSCPDREPAVLEAARAAGVEVISRQVSRRGDIARAAMELLEGGDALWLTAEPLLLEPETVRYLLGRALELRRPVVGLSSNFVRAGALLCLEPDLEDVGRLLAETLRTPAGAATDGLAAPRRATLVVNGRVARLLGLQLPEGLAGAADVRVVE